MVQKVSAAWLSLSVVTLGTFIGFSSPAFADSSPKSRNEFCLRSGNLDNFKQIAADDDNRLSFKNAGGIFGGGVCWWHSRFQRSATYLSVYRPDLSKPTLAQAKDIIHAIRWNDHVVEIPGYATLYDFSKDWHKEIQDELNRWQFRDATLRFAWVRGLWNSPFGNAAKLESIMHRLYTEVEEKSRITYMKLQLKGIPSHAWLILGMEEVPSGYMLQIIDSNFKDLVHYKYTYGDRTFEYGTYGSFEPYVEQTKDFSKINTAIHDYCLQYPNPQGE